MKTLHKKGTPNITVVQLLQQASKARKDNIVDNSDYVALSESVRTAQDDALIEEWKTLLDATIRRALDPWLNQNQGASGGPQAQGDAHTHQRDQPPP